MRVDAAISNNIALYRSIFRAHGIASDVAEHYWSSDGVAPPYYSNLVTRTADVGTDAQLERIRQRAGSPPAKEWGLKDSYARLDLAPIGLRVLFEARWYGLDPRAPLEVALESGSRFVEVSDEAALTVWEMEWQRSSPTGGRRVFPKTVLADSDMRFHSALGADGFAGGFITNRSGDDVGVSNVFSLDAAAYPAILRDAMRHTRRQFPDRAILGYGRAEELRLLDPLGFRELGPLRVWLTPKPA